MKGFFGQVRFGRISGRRLLLLIVGLNICQFYLPNLVTAGTPAETTATFSPIEPDGLNGWYYSPVNVTLTATDLENSVKSIYWRFDSGTWQNADFPFAVNLITNPSFEDGSGSDLTGWQFSGTNGALAGQDQATAKYGSTSAKITTVTNGWSYWSNQGSYAVVQPLGNMTASVWVKTAAVAGTGSFFKIYSLSSAGPALLASSPVVGGNSGWTFISKPFTVSPADAYGVYLEIGLSGTGIAWYDGATIMSSPGPTQTTFTFSQNGDHTLEYYSLNQLGVEESPHSFQNLKIDTVSPYNWRGFDLSQSGNDHTLKSEIRVDDQGSGFDGTQGYFQYSVDGGVHWGYYMNLTSCSSEWVTDGWKGLTTELEDGGKTAELKTPAVDYCNSNWSICKIVRFKVQDLAGNESTKDICINGAWSSVSGGDVYSGGDINMGAAGSQSNTDGLILTPSGTVSNFSSSRNWLISNYDHNLIAPAFDRLISKFSTLTLITALPEASGYYQTKADFTLDQNTLPTGLSSANFGAIVFVNGDLVINSNYSFALSGGIIFVVKGDVLVDKDVTDLAGLFIVSGLFDTAYNGGAKSTPLNLRGGVTAGRVILSRSLKSNDGTPAETVVFEPKYYAILGQAFSAYSITWKEVKP